MAQQPPTKRMRLDIDNVDPATLRASRAAFLDSLSRSVSPPPSLSVSMKSGVQQRTNAVHLSHDPANTSVEGRELGSVSISKASIKTSEETISEPASALAPDTIPSPFQLNKIRDLTPADNVETVSLHDVLGDPLIKEAWVFNFCFDIDWLMQHFDPDVREMVNVQIVHGSWRKDDMNKIGIDEACSRWTNVKTIQAYLPDAFGTHHSKMFVLFRHDDCAQVVIHTANMLAKDWTNMTQAVWRSPFLPLLADVSNQRPSNHNSIGIRFKDDLMRYLKAYGNKLRLLAQQLQLYDFKDVKAAIVASVPSKFQTSAADTEVWGHEMLRRKLQHVRIAPERTTVKPHFVFQVSSIASLAATWLEQTLYSACGSTKQSTSIIFPTAPDVARSLDGYAAGGSIHTKAQKEIHLKQISMLRPQLCRWTAGPTTFGRSGRNLAAPHIKTYVRFVSQPTVSNLNPDIEWALVTSANLSTQAWGSAPKLAKGERDPRKAVIHIQSYEIGVLVWPEVFANVVEEQNIAVDHLNIRMVPSFKQDNPGARDLHTGIVVGIRMPYDLPLTSYTDNEMPWSPQSSYNTPDRHGQLW